MTITTEVVNPVGQRPGDSLQIVYRDGERIGAVSTHERWTGYTAVRDRRTDDGTLELLGQRHGFGRFSQAMEWIKDQ